MPLLIDAAGGQTPDHIERSARRLKRQNWLDLLIVDHLQLMRPPRETRTQGRVQQITEFTTRMKALAKELDIPVLLLSQLNRAGERSDNKVPQLSDLRDSGSIEQGLREPDRRGRSAMLPRCAGRKPDTSGTRRRG